MTLIPELSPAVIMKDGLKKQDLFLDFYGSKEKEIQSKESLRQWLALSEASAQHQKQIWYVHFDIEDREAEPAAILKDSIVLARTMESAAASSDPIELSNAAFELKDKLEELWEFRRGKEDDWGDLLNMLQCSIFADVEFERFSVQKCTAIRMVLELLSGPIGFDELTSGEEYLSNADFDPWAVVSSQDPNTN
jgi:hypothetical protein